MVSMPANIASCCTCDLHVPFPFTFHLPVAWALRAPLKPLKAAGGPTAWRELGGKELRALPQLRACWRDIWWSLG